MAAFAVSGAALGGAVRAPRLTGGEEGSLVFRRTGPFLTRAGGARVGGSGTHGAMRAAAASSRKAVVVAEGENDGLASKADSAQFQSDELEVPDVTEETMCDAGVADAQALNRVRVVPPPSDGQKIFQIDPMLQGYKYHLEYRYSLYRRIRSDIDEHEGGLEAFSRSYEKFGFNRSAEGITYREWAPGALSAALVGDFNNWDPNADRMSKNEFGVWEIFLPNNADGTSPIPHGTRVKVRMDTPSGIKDSIPAWIKYSVQAPGEIPYDGLYYDPPEEVKYVFKHPKPKRPKSLRIYETHVGMSSPEPKINTYANFRDEVLPRIKKLGYNAVQIMAIQEHSYYGSFG